MIFAGKVVLVTGASTGIGRAIALRFAGLGAQLSLSGLKHEDLQKVSDECETLNKHKPLIAAGDLTNEAHTKSVLQSTIKHFNKLDVLVNNAGIFEAGSIESTSLGQFDRLFNMNVKAPYYMTMLAVPHLIKSKGNIVNTASVCGLRATPGVLAYNMTKTAVNQFTQCVALELADRQVRVNSVNPGVIKTVLFDTIGKENTDDFFEFNKKSHALGRNGVPDEVAKAVTFLASDEHAAFITGVHLSVDGGRQAMSPLFF